MTRVTKFLYLISTSYKKILLLFAIVLAAFSIGASGLLLKFDTNQDNLISKSQDYVKDYNAFLKEFGDWEYIYVVAKIDESKNHFAAKKFSKELTADLKKHPDLFASVINKIDISELRKNFLLLAPKKDFAQFEQFFSKNETQINEFLSIQTAADWYAFVSSLFKNDINTTNEQELEKYWPFLKDALYAPFDQESLTRIHKTNLFTLMSGKYMDPNGYLFSENGNLLFIRILPHKDFSQMEIIGKPLDYLRSIISDLRLKYPKLEIGVTGRPVLQNDEATSTQADSEYAGLVAFALVAILFFVFFKGYKRSLFTLFTLFIGISWTTGFVTLVYGSVNLITIVFAIILIGLGVDYGIHYLIRYQAEMLKQKNYLGAIKETTTHTGSAIILGALTSAIAFATALFTDFLGLEQLGIIAGVGIIFCCLSQLTVFPALLALFDHKADPTDKIPSFKKFEVLIRRPKSLLVIITIITLVCLPLAIKTGFSSNILELQDQELESVRFEKIIQDNSDISTWFLAYQTKDLSHLRKIKKQVENLKTVKRTESIINILPEDQADRLSKLNKIKPTIHRHISQAKTDTLNQLIKLQSHFDNLANKAFKSGMAEEFDELNTVSTKLNDLIQTQKLNPNNPPNFSKKFLTFIKSSQNLLLELLQASQMTEDMIPEDLVKIYKGKNNFYSLSIYPKKDIWLEKNMEEFIKEVRLVIPNVTGAPITSYESSKKMIQGFILVAILTSILVLLMIFKEFKNFKITVIIFGNLILTFVWLLAFMNIYSININLANFFALPVLIGSGIDHGIHVFHRYREQHSLHDLFESTIPAITLSCLTTIFGFGSLAFVRHNGLASFGLIMAVGTFFILISSVVILPNLIQLRLRLK